MCVLLKEISISQRINNQRKTIVNSWVHYLENNQLVITSAFPTVNFKKMIEIQIINILSLFWKHNTFLAARSAE